MPFSYSIDLEKGVVNVRGWGEISWDNLSEHLGHLLSDPALPHPYRHLVDLREAENFTLTSDDARKTAALFAQRPALIDGRLAFIATEPLVYGMVRVLQAVSRKTINIGVFSNRAEAEAFLEL
ncbi:MAG: hypothetical protein KJ970_05785 [Candidatus Eisenbacteria bacterium]|uniref:STAS/SEC14 domain-containing protein n=1 Tax=Eiseniibacteriota bacterium TaxID=2212470 RepID=A0A948RT62_UNCEI|nr:hypothetical protein [Candidatus Eisenbacteria bacterium]MBU1949347.1 hypothetical protein [Candidatus Eisenbacteria bacterium]MBU2690420.1 hypothetical protein [Candidatus Eisenbacteria bacterium]